VIRRDTDGTPDGHAAPEFHLAENSSAPGRPGIPSAAVALIGLRLFRPGITTSNIKHYSLFAHGGIIGNLVLPVASDFVGRKYMGATALFVGAIADVLFFRKPRLASSPGGSGPRRQPEAPASRTRETSKEFQWTFS